MRNLTIGFIGLGLIGGSIAKSLRHRFPNYKIIAYNRSNKARELALEEGVADIATEEIDSNFSECDYIFLCTPVEYNVLYLKKLKDIISPNCIITDVGSVKGNIHEAVLSEGMERNFIGGHPMAGSEKTGYENANRYILENAYYVITPTAVVSKESVAEFTSIVAATGAIPVQLDYHEHDYAVAAISHVPHLIAAKLVTLVKDSDSPCQTMKMLAAGGFKDITRIASSSPEMWQQICSTNVENITKLMDDYIASMTEIRNAISNHEFTAVHDLFEVSREYRNSFSDHRSGPILKVYALYLDLADESGAISNVARILADADISIKNIGIIHNREFEDGVLKIEFYDNESLDRSTRLLPDAGYKIYRR
jgi:prephenate dehydrogenase